MERLYPDRLAVWDGEMRLTFEELGRRVDALAGALKAKGVRRGDRVGILDVNSYRYAEAYYACAHAGMILLPLNSRLAPPELMYVLNDSGAKALIVTEPFVGAVEGQHVEVLVKDYEAFLRTGNPDTAVEKVELEDIAQIYYTSGTTGEPKGVCLTYGNMIASAFDSIVGLELGRDDVWLHAAPMFHLVDAWSIWDPYFAIGEKRQNGRILVNAREVAKTNSFYLANRDFANGNVQRTREVIKGLTEAAQWAESHRDVVANSLAAVTAVPLDVQIVAANRASFVIGPVTDEIIDTQQAVADRFYKLGFIPRQIVIRDIVWRPAQT